MVFILRLTYVSLEEAIGHLYAAVEAHKASVADASAGAVLADAVPAAATNTATSAHILHVSVLPENTTTDGSAVLHRRPSVSNNSKALTSPVKLAFVVLVPNEGLALCPA